MEVLGVDAVTFAASQLITLMKRVNGKESSAIERIPKWDTRVLKMDKEGGGPV